MDYMQTLSKGCNFASLLMNGSMQAVFSVCIPDIAECGTNISVLNYVTDYLWQHNSCFSRTECNVGFGFCPFTVNRPYIRVCLCFGGFIVLGVYVSVPPSPSFSVGSRSLDSQLQP
jgi:hypothetical protein